MKHRLILAASLAGLSVLAVPAVAGAQPTPNPNGPAHTGTACEAILSQNQAIHSDAPGIVNHFYQVGVVFCNL